MSLSLTWELQVHFLQEQPNGNTWKVILYSQLMVLRTHCPTRLPVPPCMHEQFVLPLLQLLSFFFFSLKYNLYKCIHVYIVIFKNYREYFCFKVFIILFVSINIVYNLYLWYFNFKIFYIYLSTFIRMQPQTLLDRMMLLGTPYLPNTKRFRVFLWLFQKKKNAILAEQHRRHVGSVRTNNLKNVD